MISYYYRDHFESILNGESRSAYEKMLTQQVIDGRLSEADLVQRMRQSDQWPDLDEYAALLVNNDGLRMTVDRTDDNDPVFHIDLHLIEEDDVAKLHPKQAKASSDMNVTHYGRQTEVFRVPMPDEVPPGACELWDRDEYAIQSVRTHISHGVIERGQYKPLMTHLDASHPAMSPPTKDVDLSLLT